MAHWRPICCADGRKRPAASTPLLAESTSDAGAICELAQFFSSLRHLVCTAPRLPAMDSERPSLNFLFMEEAFMLVLSRKQTQELRVGNDITITVLEVRGNVVRLGIQAPRDVRILRGE